MILETKLVPFVLIICAQHLQVCTSDDYEAIARRVIKASSDLQELVQSKVDEAEEAMRQAVQKTHGFVEGLDTYLSDTAKTVFEFHGIVNTLKENADSNNITEDVCPVNHMKVRIDDLPGVFANHTKNCREKVSSHIQEEVEGVTMEITRINYDTFQMMKMAINCTSSRDYPSCVADMEAMLASQQTMVSQQIAKVIYDAETKLNSIQNRGVNCATKAVDEELLDTRDYIETVVRCIRKNISREIYDKKVIFYGVVDQ